LGGESRHVHDYGEMYAAAELLRWQAIGMADKQDALLWRLRAAADLARLLAEHGAA
jgi:hypothetical protein